MFMDYALRTLAPMQGNRLRLIRDQHGLRQQDVAEAIGVSEAQISRWENGKDSMPSVRLPEIAEAYRCGIGEIFEAPPSAADYAAALRNARLELPMDLSLADFLEAAGASVHTQIQRLQSDRASTAREAQSNAPDRDVRPQPPTRRGARG